MRKIFVLLFTLQAFLSFGQTISYDRVIGRQGFYLYDRWITRFQNDTLFNGSTDKVPTSDAVYRFVLGRAFGGGGISSIDSSTWATRRWVDSLFDATSISFNTLFTGTGTEADPIGIDTATILAGLLRKTAADTYYPSMAGSYANPSWISSLAWSKITGTPTTIAGYGITDAFNGDYNNLTNKPTIPQLSSISLTLPGLLFNTPVNLSNASGAWSGTFTLASQSAASILGNFGSTSAAPTWNAATADGQLLVRRSGSLTFGTLTAADIPNHDASKITSGTFAAAQLASGTATNGYVITSLSGTPTWQAPNGGGGAADSSFFWKRLGNVATYGDFFGTINNLSLRFRTNNVERMVLDSSGNLKLGNTTSTAITTPLQMNLGGTVGSNTGGTSGNLKLLVYDDGSNKWGIGASNSTMEFQTGSSSSMKFYQGSTLVATMTSLGLGVGTGGATNYQLGMGSNLNNTKLALYENGSNIFGMGIQSFQFRLHLSSSGDRFSFLSAPAGTELFTIKGNGQLGINNSSPNAKAILDITSTTLGVLPPRMTATQASAITLTTTEEGMFLYVKDTNATFTSKGWWGWDGAAWQKLNN